MNSISRSSWNSVRDKVVALFPQLEGLDDRSLARKAGPLCFDFLNCVDLWILWKVAEGATIERGECEAQR